MPVLTATITSRCARKAKRKDSFLCRTPPSLSTHPLIVHSQRHHPAHFCWSQKENTFDNSTSKRYFNCQTGAAANTSPRVIMQGGEAHTLAETQSSEKSAGQLVSTSDSSNNSSPTSTRGPAGPLVSGSSEEQIPQGIERSFKRRRSFNSRRRDVNEILKKHPNKVPIIIERSRNEKTLGLLDKSKFLVPEELTMSQLTTIIRRRLRLTDSQAFYLIINRRTMVSASMTLSEVYQSDKDTDGFLYITYASQEMFG